MGDPEAKSDPFIHLPATLVLSKGGVNALGNSPAVKRVQNREGSACEGLQSDSYNAPTVQKLIMNSYLDEINVQLPDLLSRRFEVLSTNNLIIYAILYKKLTPALATMLFSSDIVKAFNRKNPKHSLVDLAHISKPNTEKLMAAKPEEFQAMRDGIEQEVLGLVETNSSISDEDREIRMRATPKFIAWVDVRIWYLYYIIYQTPMRDAMRVSFARMIALYLDHTQIGTHLGNLLMEFIQNAEKAHLERLIVQGNIAGRDDVDAYLRDRKNREFIIAEAERRKQWLDVSWSMKAERSSSGKQYHVRIAVSNFGLIDDSTQRMLASKMKTDVEGINVASFYTDSGEEGKLGAGLGLLYNSYLEDICKAEGIYYRCFIYPEPRLERTTVNVEISL